MTDHPDHPDHTDADRHPRPVPMWSLTKSTLVEIGEDGTIVVLTRWGEFEFADDPTVAESLRRMALGPISLDNVAGSAAELARLHRVLDRLPGAVVRSVALADGQGPVLSLVPLEPVDRFEPRPVRAGTPVRLSRFAAIRPNGSDISGGDITGGDLALESPRAHFHVLLARPVAVRIVCALARTTSAGRVAADLGLPVPAVSGVLAYLVAAGVVVADEDRAGFGEDTDPRLRWWTYHQMLFHARGRTREDEQALFELPATRAGVPIEEPPLTKPVPDGPSVPLYRPDLAVAMAADPPLTSLLETDHRWPAFSPGDLAADRIGELLFRGARIRSVGPTHLPGAPPILVSQRPYFNIACLYELELYLTADRCRGLAPGIYHYDPAGHALTLVNTSQADRTAVLDLAMVAGGGHRRPACLLTVTVRMERTAWALDGSAYATALSHFGALQQTLYLTAKTIGLAVHAVPLDAGYRVDRALKLRWIDEAAIGVCVLDTTA